MNNNTVMTNEEQIMMRKDFRDKLVGRIETLEKVKNLLLIPYVGQATMSQVAEYYNVPIEAIRTQYKRNREEFELDGAIKQSSKSMKSLIGSLRPNQKVTNYRGRIEFKIDDEFTLIVPNVGIVLFPKRAILRMGMLLRDSEVAKEVRTQLLNIVQHTSEKNPELLTANINKEQQLLLGIGQAYSSGNIIEVLKATQALDSFRQRHIKAIEKENVSLANSNKLLTTEILKISDRKSMSRVMRMMVNELGLGYSEAYAMVYKQLNYRYGINLKSRGDKSKPYVKHLRDNEWKLVQKIIVAILEENNVDTTKFFEKCKIVKSKK